MSLGLEPHNRQFLNRAKSNPLSHVESCVTPRRKITFVRVENSSILSDRLAKWKVRGGPRIPIRNRRESFHLASLALKRRRIWWRCWVLPPGPCTFIAKRVYHHSLLVLRPKAWRNLRTKKILTSNG